MCIGIPMKIIGVNAGFAVAEGFGEQRRVNTALVGECSVGQWVIVFLNDAREIISPERASEVTETLKLVMGALHPDGEASIGDDPSFSLPSAMNLSELNTLTQV